MVEISTVKSMTTYTITSRDRDQTVQDVLAREQHIHRAFDATATQAAIARRALTADESLTVGDLADAVDTNPRYVVEILEYASPQQLADIVLAYHGYDPRQALLREDEAKKAELYEKRLPELLDEVVVDE